VLHSDDLAAILSKTGLKQVELARLLHVHRQRVSYWLRGNRRVPRAVSALLRLRGLFPLDDA
jgi:DNA-binding transcriptional regulator YiaG